MSNDIEELLRDGMERTTAEVRMAPDLAGRLAGQAARRHRRRLRTRAGATGGTVLGAAGLTVAGFATAGTPATAPGGTGATHGGTGATHGGTGASRVQTAAYVLSHVNHALQGGHTVARIVTTQQSGGQRQTATSWFYGESAQTQVSVYAAPGGGIVTRDVSHVSGGTDELTTTTVNYLARQWLTKTDRFAALPTSGASCAPGVTAGAAMNKPHVTVGPAVNAAVLRQLVSCGNFIVAGRQQVAGGSVIKLVSASGKNPGITSETVWVDSSTYLPVRVLLSLRRFELQSDVQWLPATPASLAHLRLGIPAGFKRISEVAVPAARP
jgi:hypothetical protein